MKGNYIGNNPNGLDFVLVDNKTTIEKNKKIVSKDIAINGDDTDLASGRGQIGAPKNLPAGTDANSLTKAGFYQINTGGLNLPDTGAYFLHVYQREASATNRFYVQVAWKISNTKKLSFRSFNESTDTWTEWIDVITTDDLATSSTPGIVQLNNTTSSTSASQAATANAVKLAYDKAVAAYTKAESAQGSSASADKLTTARTIQTNLASTASASFDGTENVTPGVTGVLPVANGGTGRTDGKAPSLVTKRTIDGVSFDGSANITHFGECSTEAATAAKVVSVANFVLATGSEVTVQFTVTNTAASPTLNVNNTGAKAIVYRNAAISAGYLAANRVYKFVYDGTNYELIGDVNTDTNTDTKVTQTVTTTNAEYPLLVSADANKTSSSTTTARFASGATLNPSTKKITCSGISGINATTSWVNAAKVGGSLTEFDGIGSGKFQPFIRSKSTNGVFLLDGYQDYITFSYLTDENITNNKNTVTESLQFNESGLLTSSGGFKGSLTGNASSATKLATARTIDGVSFNGTANITHFGKCSTEAETAAKTVSVTGFTLATGAEVTVQFTVTNTAKSPTLNVNSTGEKAIVYRNAAISAGYLAANRVYKFVYDGTNYELIGDIDTNTKYSVATTSKAGIVKPDGTTIKINSGTLTWNTIDVSPLSEKYQSLGNATGSKAINLNNGLSISATITGATTFSFTNVPSSGSVVVVMQLTNGGAYTITWPSSIKWSGGKAPKFTSSGIDIVVLTTNDAGATWYGIVNLKYA